MFGLQGGQPGSSCMVCGVDLWDVGRCASAGAVVICQSCVDVLKQAMDDAVGNGEIEVTAPARVHGAAPDDTSVAAVAKAFVTTFRSGGGGDLHDYLEDADELSALLRQGSARYPIAQIRVRVDAIRFLDPERAEVRYQVMPNGGPTGFPFQGTAVRRGGTWRVTRESVARGLSTIGIIVPPRPE